MHANLFDPETVIRLAGKNEMLAGDLRIPLRHNGWPVNYKDFETNLAAIFFFDQNGLLQETSFPECRELFPVMLAHYGEMFVALVPGGTQNCGALLLEQQRSATGIHALCGISGGPVTRLTFFNRAEDLNLATAPLKKIMADLEKGRQYNERMLSWLDNTYPCTDNNATPHYSGEKITVPEIIADKNIYRSELAPTAGTQYIVSSYEKKRAATEKDYRDICRGILRYDRLLMPVREKDGRSRWHMFKILQGSNPPVFEEMLPTN
jgi:hypothetical protein